MQCLWSWATTKTTTASTDSSDQSVLLRNVRGLVSPENAVPEKIPEELTLDALLEMNESKVKETMKRCGASVEDCSRLNGALACLRKVTRAGAESRDDSVWHQPGTCRENSLMPPPELPPCPMGLSWMHGSLPLLKGNGPQPRSVSVSAILSSDTLPLGQGPPSSTESLLESFAFPTPCGRRNLRTPHSITITPPATPQLKRGKPPRTPPPPSRKVFQLLPNFSTLTRSKSHESQLGNRIDEVPPAKFGKRCLILAILTAVPERVGSPHLVAVCQLFTPPKTFGSGLLWNCRTGPWGQVLVKSSLPKVFSLKLHNPKDHLPQGSPQTVRRNIGLSVTHRFSTKSWLSQSCQVCQKSMMFGVKCKHCRLKCHNKCTKEAPPCRISFLPLVSPLRRTESVPSDINNPVDRPSEPQFGTLPKALTKKDHAPAINHLDSSSNPSSTTSSTPSSPAPFQSSNPPSATPPLNPSPMGQRDSRFNFPEIPNIPHVTQPPESTESTNVDEHLEIDGVEERDTEVSSCLFRMQFCLISVLYNFFKNLYAVLYRNIKAYSNLNQDGLQQFKRTI
ncbi:Kinase suppressor of Ras 1 [Varanus komodoensis]|nr:Kinase suppressor of Ras 1 [Varanus komodoensis]